MSYLDRFTRKLLDPDKQLELLDARRMRRNTDPVSSHVSAEKMVAPLHSTSARGAQGGHAQRHRDQLLDLIRAHPGRDVSGLVVCAVHDGYPHLDRASISKRLSELHERGLITHPETTGKARRWFAV